MSKNQVAKMESLGKFSLTNANDASLRVATHASGDHGTTSVMKCAVFSSTISDKLCYRMTTLGTDTKVHDKYADYAAEINSES